MALVAELRQRMSNMQEENAATKVRLDMQVIRVTRLMHMGDTPHSYVCTRVTCLIHLCDTISLYAATNASLD